MPPKTPDFWYRDGALDRAMAIALSPLSLAYGAITGLRRMLAKPADAEIPVTCVGNLVTGGGGKTPTALMLRQQLLALGIARNPCFLSRGYGGALPGPVMVDVERHSAADVGDEPLLLARAGPTIVARDRHQGAMLARDQGADMIVMDDGMQNNSLRRDLTFCVIDGASGLGNGRLLPAGPLRQTIAQAGQTADAFIIVGRDDHNVARLIGGSKPVLHAELSVPAGWLAPGAPHYVAFCGIARPEKFFTTAESVVGTLAARHAFSDHYRFLDRDLVDLANSARRFGARLITTEKDLVRLPAEFVAANEVIAIPVELGVTQTDILATFLYSRLGPGA